jgi:hypothetical protein
MLNGNYIDCYGNIDNDMGHHTTNPSDQDPGHHSGMNCPSGSLLGNMGGMPGGGNSMGAPQNWMFNWFDINNTSIQWVIIPLTANTIQKLFNNVYYQH